MPFLKPSEIASALRVSTQTVRRLIDNGELTAVMVGKQRRVDDAELARYLKRTEASGDNA